MKKLLILGFLIIQITLSASSFQNFTPQSDTIIKEDSMNFAILMVDFLCYSFEAASISYYTKCPDNCDIDSLPVYMYFDPTWDYARVYFYYKYDSSLLFGAWIIWMGTGWIFYPTNFLPHEMFSYGEESVPLPEDAEIYNTTIAGNYCSWEEYVIRAHKAWDAIDSLEITQQFAAKPFHVGLYAYSRREGVFDPVKADWIIFLYRGNEFPASVADLELKKSFSILPNPATDRIKVEFYETLEEVEIDVLDIFGSVIHQTRNQPSSRQIVIPTSSWTPGVYIIKVRSGDHIIGVKRVIKL